MLTIREVIKTLYNALLQRLKRHRGNWDQNDPTADDYIKNRPFYTDETNKETVVKTKTFTAESSYWWGSPFAFIPVVGDTYKVTWDDEEYICIGKIADWGGKYIGNASIDGDGLDTGEPFFYYWYDSSDYGLCVRYQGQHTITIETIKIVKIDERYLPDNEEIEMAIEDLCDYANYINNEVQSTVRYIPQNLSTSQKQTARTNIGAASMAEVNTALNNLGNTKVDKVDGQGLSSNDYTDADKEKLAGLTTYTPGFFYSSVIPKFVRIVYSKSYKNIVFDFGVRFKPSETFLNYANNGRLTINASSRGYTIPLGSYIKTYDGMDGFGFYSSSADNTHLVFFTEEGQMWVRPDGQMDLSSVVDDFNSGRTIKINLPDCIDAMTIDPKLVPDLHQIAYEDYIDTLVMCGGGTSSQVRRPLHSSIRETQLTNDSYYFAKEQQQVYLVLEFPRNIVVNNRVYNKSRVDWLGYGVTTSEHIEYAYGNLSLIPEELCSYDTSNSNSSADFALIKSKTVEGSGTVFMHYYLFSKEDGYQLPEVYERTYTLKQLDENLIPDTIARTEDIEGLATEEYVDTKVSDLINAAPEALDTLKELSTALGDDPNFATTVLTQLGNKADVASLEGLATESYVDNALSELGGTPIITDTTTGKHYELYVENGKLTMKETGVMGGKAIFKDVATGASYELYVENGTLSMKEAE